MKIFKIESAQARSCVAGLVFLGAGSVKALDLSDIPLVVSVADDPNIMLLFDTSGSMNCLINDSTSTGCDSTSGSDPTSRLSIAQDAAAMLLNNNISNAYVGLAIFGEGGAQIEKGLTAIESTGDVNRTNLIAAINALTADQSTPLTSSLAQVGRYFIQDTASNVELDVTASSAGITSPMSGHTLFANPPSYDGSVDQEAKVIRSSCQKNFVIALTDGVPTSDENYNDDLATWDDNTVTNMPGVGDPVGTGDLDDVAAAMYDLDFRPTDTSFKSNIITYTVGFDLASNSDALTLLSNAAAAGGGLFAEANDAAALNAAFTNFATNLFSQVASVASVAFNTSQLESGSAIFQAKFDTTRWSGEFSAYPLSATGDISATATWEAGAELDSMTPSDRKIFTYDGSDGIPFEWANLTATQKADLYKGVDLDGDGNTTNDDQDGKALLEYIRGVRTNEGATSSEYRVRDSSLGDIVNSSPVFVGAPQLNWPENDGTDNTLFGGTGTSTYSSFKTANGNVTRKPVVYVGANDGMLHGFSASLTAGDKGDEVFAYIPNALFSTDTNKGLHYLASQQYRHKFYVDATPVVSDVYIDPPGNPKTEKWRTILVGGLRAGGRGLYALDITDPSNFTPANAGNAESVALWEFTSADDNDLGYTYSEPTIAMMANGEWAVIFGNGYASGDGTSTAHSKLFILFIQEGIDGSWTVGSDYIKIDADTTGNNGMATPRVVDLDGDSVADIIYAGDLKGNMWAFDVSSSTASNWAGTKTKLFTATDASGNTQPITTAPLVAINPNDAATPSAATPNLLVMFGAGKYLESDDNSNKDEMSYYTVWDMGTGNHTRSSLASREVVSKDVTDGSGAVVGGLRKVNGTAVDWTTQKGWYMDLLDISAPNGSGAALGERVVTDSLLRSKVLFFNTIIPDSEDCTNSGTGWLMSLQFDTGLAPSFAVFDANNDGSITTADIGGAGSRFTHGMPLKSGVLGEKQYTPGSDGDIETRDINVGAGEREGRLSWFEKYRD